MLELKHTVDDQMNVATSTVFLPLRAFLHRQRDNIVCYSQIIREITTTGQSQADRTLIITDRHLYVVSLPTSAMFAPPSTGGAFPLSDFSKVCHVKGTQHCLFQFVGATIAMRFSSANDAQRCAGVMFSLTAIPVETVAPSELGSLHARKIIGAPNSLSQSIAAAHLQAKSDAADGGSSGAPDADKPDPRGRNAAASSGTAAGTQQQTPRPAVQKAASSASGGGGQGATSTVDNMLRFILESNDSNVYESLFPEAAVQTEFDTDESSTQVVVETRDAATSPIRRRDMSPGRHSRASPAGGGGGGLGVGADGSPSPKRFEFDTASEDSASGLSEFDAGLMWRSLQRGGSTSGPSAAGPSAGAASAPGTGIGRMDSGSAGPPSPKASGTMSFDAWLGILTQYKPGLVEQGLDSIGKVSRLSPAELDAAMDAANITRAGHRVLLTSKVNVARQARTGRR